jgi:aryl-alcohol dehydrogenase-like predicted oxidoreductase
MERRPLGKTGLVCGVIGLGTWRTFDVPLSSHAEMEMRQAIVDTAIEADVDLFDSSPMYGKAEAVLGRTLQGKRDRVLVATKVWAPSVSQGRQQIDQALRYFDGSVDLYQVHNLVSWREYLPLLSELQAENSIRAVGVTHYAHSAFPALAAIMESEEIGTVQVPYSAVDREVERRILPLAEEREIGVIVMSPLGTGRLTREAPPADELKPFQGFGVTTWAQVLLKWVVSDTRVTVTIPATSKVERARENALAGNPPFFGPEERERVSWLARRLVG